jgi:hypothetical protein
MFLLIKLCNSLQDFTVLPTDIFRRYVIKVSSVVIYRCPNRRKTFVDFPFVGNTIFRRYIGGKNKKNICRWFYRRNVQAKKNFPA